MRRRRLLLRRRRDSASMSGLGLAGHVGVLAGCASACRGGGGGGGGKRRQSLRRAWAAAIGARLAGRSLYGPGPRSITTHGGPRGGGAGPCRQHHFPEPLPWPGTRIGPCGGQEKKKQGAIAARAASFALTGAAAMRRHRRRVATIACHGASHARAAMRRDSRRDSRRDCMFESLCLGRAALHRLFDPSTRRWVGGVTGLLFPALPPVLRTELLSRILTANFQVLLCPHLCPVRGALPAPLGPRSRKNAAGCMFESAVTRS